jgi:hypothetical protein
LVDNNARKERGELTKERREERENNSGRSDGDARKESDADVYR